MYREQLADVGAERQRIEIELSNYLQGLARSLESAGVGARCTVRFGPPAEEILSRWAYGSVADRVLREASCPVLLVRAK